jgi:predicted lipoprotein with Yx(FWY)xxD motif
MRGTHGAALGLLLLIALGAGAAEAQAPVPPPLHWLLPAGAPASAGALSIVTRDDGSKQYAWNGKPLSYYADDATPGGTAGHNVGKAWFVVQP